MIFTNRIATYDDVNAIKRLMALSMAKLLPDVLTPEQVEKSSLTMGLDTQLLDDETYFLVLDGEKLVGCGGWSRRRTLYGGNHTAGRDSALADPTAESAKIRAMYTHPAHTRQGIGRLILSLGEAAAKSEGFKSVELGATASGLLLYEKCGYKHIKDLTEIDSDGIAVPLLLMRKVLS